MYCYNCGCLLTENDFCTNCGAEVKVYKKIIAASNRFYNNGLEKAGVRDLSGAIESLKQCLKLNKNHVEARNLLGLIYYETGEAVSALNEWVISKNVQPKKNIADDYIEEIRSNPTQLDTLAQSIKKFNQALVYCQQDSLDLAVIQLRKVLSMNADYLKAHQLLALVYINNDELEKAKRELEKARRIDRGSVLTLRYLKEVNELLSAEDAKDQSKNKKKKQKDKDKEAGTVRYQSGNDTVIQPVNQRESGGLSTIFNMIIGVIIGLAAAIFLILPARIQAETAKINEQIGDYSDRLNAETADKQELEAHIQDLNEEIERLEQALDSYTGTDGALSAYDQLMAAVRMYFEEEPDALAIADSLGRLDETYIQEGASDNYREVFYALRAVIGAEVSEAYYQSGMTEYNSGNYEEAVNYLEMAVSFNEEDSRPLYQLGEAYYQLENWEDAARCYELVIERFAGSTLATNSQRRLNEIQPQD